MNADGDGTLDLVVTFETPESGFEAGDDLALPVGTTTAGTPIYGADDVWLRAPGQGRPRRDGPAGQPRGRTGGRRR